MESLYTFLPPSNDFIDLNFSVSMSSDIVHTTVHLAQYIHIYLFTLLQSFQTDNRSIQR